MPLFRASPPARLAPALLASALLAGCGAADERPSAVSAWTSPPAAAPAPAAPPAAPASAGRGAREGHHVCSVHGADGVRSSAVASIRVLGAGEYESMGRRGRYAREGALLWIESGPLAGRVARLRESGPRSAIVFLRGENEVDGRPAIDPGDTWCYHQPR